MSRSEVWDNQIPSLQTDQFDSPRIRLIRMFIFGPQAYLFKDYWEDIGTVKSFFDANLALTEQVDYFFEECSSIDENIYALTSVVCVCAFYGTASEV